MTNPGVKMADKNILYKVRATCKTCGEMVHAADVHDAEQLELVSYHMHAAVQDHVCPAVPNELVPPTSRIAE